MEKFQNKYRILSARAQWWDYGCNAAYFVTICTARRKYYFGDIAHGEMRLSELGEIACYYWDAIPRHFPFVMLGEFVIMPNHVHGIIIIDNPDDNRLVKPPIATVATIATVETPNLGVSTIPIYHPRSARRRDKTQWVGRQK